MPVPRLRFARSIRPAAVAAAAAATLAAGLLAATPAPAAHATHGTTPNATAPAFLVPSSQRASSLPRPRAVAGTSRVVSLDTALLPSRAAGQRIGFDLGRQSVTGRFTGVEHNRDFTAWTGTLDVDYGTFTIVRSGSVYRASISWPQGLWQVTQARGSAYWLTDVAPYAGRSGDDTVSAAVGSTEQRRLADAAPAARKHRGKSKVDVLFGYTPAAKAAAGSKAAIKAAVGQAAATTNQALANSGVKVKIRVKGIVKVKGHESSSVVKDAKRLQRPHDGHFDSVVRARKRHHADLVHLLSEGPPNLICGAGAIPRKPREAAPINGFSTSYLSCLPYIVATHEIGHNLGADHISYPGVSHDSRMRGAYGWYDVPHHFLTTMGYYNPCEDAGDYSCVRIPWFSTPKTTYYGFPVGSEAANNAKVIKRIAPLVARYSRRGR